MTAELLAMVNTDPEYAARPGPGLDAVQAALDGAATTVEAEFTFPYLCHAMMEPLNCVIEPVADGCLIVHDGCQSLTTVHK